VAPGRLAQGTVFVMHEGDVAPGADVLQARHIEPREHAVYATQLRCGTAECGLEKILERPISIQDQKAPGADWRDMLAHERLEKTFVEEFDPVRLEAFIDAVLVKPLVPWLEFPALPETIPVEAG